MNRPQTDIRVDRHGQQGGVGVHAASLRTSTPAAAATTHWPVSAVVAADLAPRKGSPMRRAYLQIRFGALVNGEIRWMARFIEVDAPSGVKPVDWLLASQRRLDCATDTFDLLGCRPDLVIGLDLF